MPEIGTITAAAPAARDPDLATARARSTTRSSAAACTTGSTTRPREKEFEIVLARVPHAPEQLAREVVGFVHRLRETDLTKVPGIAETLDWAAALMSLGARELTPELVDETLGVVLKYEEDIRQLRGEQTDADR